jgi:hypothetical protein
MCTPTVYVHTHGLCAHPRFMCTPTVYVHTHGLCAHPWFMCTPKVYVHTHGLPHGISRRLLPEAYQSQVVTRSIPISDAVWIFPPTTRTFTKDTALSENGGGMCELTRQGNGMGTAWTRHGNGMDTAWYVWISRLYEGFVTCSDTKTVFNAYTMCL